MMTTFMQHLRAFAETYSLSVLILNGTSSVTSGRATGAPRSRKPALGPSFTYMTDVTLWLSRTEPKQFAEDEEALDETLMSTFTAEVLRSRTTASLSMCPAKLFAADVLVF